MKIKLDTNKFRQFLKQGEQNIHFFQYKFHLQNNCLYYDNAIIKDLPLKIYTDKQEKILATANWLTSDTLKLNFNDLNSEEQLKLAQQTSLNLIQVAEDNHYTSSFLKLGEFIHTAAYNEYVNYFTRKEQIIITGQGIRWEWEQPISRQKAAEILAETEEDFNIDNLTDSELDEIFPPNPVLRLDANQDNWFRSWLSSSIIYLFKYIWEEELTYYLKLAKFITLTQSGKIEQDFSVFFIRLPYYTNLYSSLFQADNIKNCLLFDKLFMLVLEEECNRDLNQRDFHFPYLKNNILDIAFDRDLAINGNNPEPSLFHPDHINKTTTLAQEWEKMGLSEYMIETKLISRISNFWRNELSVEQKTKFLNALWQTAKFNLEQTEKMTPELEEAFEFDWFQVLADNDFKAAPVNKKSKASNLNSTDDIKKKPKTIAKGDNSNLSILKSLEDNYPHKSHRKNSTLFKFDHPHYIDIIKFLNAEASNWTQAMNNDYFSLLPTTVRDNMFQSFDRSKYYQPLSLVIYGIDYRFYFGLLNGEKIYDLIDKIIIRVVVTDFPIPDDISYKLTRTDFPVSEFKNSSLWKRSSSFEDHSLHTIEIITEANAKQILDIKQRWTFECANEQTLEKLSTIVKIKVAEDMEKIKIFFYHTYHNMA